MILDRFRPFFPEPDVDGTLNLDHLDEHRRTILRASLFVGVAALAPVPLVDDWLSKRTRRDLLRTIARARHIDFADEAALFALLETGPNDLLSASAGVLALVRRAERRLLMAMLVAQAVDRALATYRLATLFDHYSYRHHVGGALDKARAAELRAVIAKAETPLEPVKAAFFSGIRAGSRLLFLAPSRLTKSIVRMAKRSQSPILDFETGFFRTGIDIVDEELRRGARVHVTKMVAKFDAHLALISPRKAISRTP